MEFLKKNAKLIVLISFVILTLFIGYFHEPWSDEAQSWLIARDQSVKDIFFYNASYEGCFPLWIIVLKMFISLGLSYEHINVVSTIISAIGVYVLLYKTEINPKVKYLLPFTFFIFYQYTVIARNYTFFILAISLLIAFYEKRHEKKITYFSILALFSMISLHGMLISGSLFFEYLIEEFLEYRKTKKLDKKSIIFSVCLVLFYLFEVILLIPKSNTYIQFNYKEDFGSLLIHILIKVFVFVDNKICLFLNVISVIFFIMVFVKAKMHNRKSIAFSLMEMLLMIQFLVIRSASHHFGILFLVMFTEVIIDKKEEEIMEKLVTIVLACYIILNIVTCMNEIYGNYSGAKQMAEYVKELDDFNKENVYAVGYKTTAILPYFKENVYGNRRDAYYLWSTDNYEWVLYNNSECVNGSELFKDEGYPKYILIQLHDLSNRDDIIRETIEESLLYDIKYETTGKNYYKSYYSESEGYVLYELKENKIGN